MNLLPTNESLIKAIQETKLSREEKDGLISKIPQLNEGARLKLLETLKNIYLLDLEEAEVLSRVQKNWQE